MRDFKQAWAHARDGHTFSNHTEYELWSGAWCATCQRDAPFRNGLVLDSCPLPHVAVMGRVPAEWIPQGGTDVHRFTCLEYCPPGGGGGEPRPKPEPPQPGLFPRPPRARRMLAGRLPVEVRS